MDAKTPPPPGVHKWCAWLTRSHDRIPPACNQVATLHATAGIPCDMAVGSGGARFKSIVLKQLSLIDPRLPDMIRIVKQWAKAWNLNDASDGTFNTFALSMMVNSWFFNPIDTHCQ